MGGNLLPTVVGVESARLGRFRVYLDTPISRNRRVGRIGGWGDPILERANVRVVNMNQMVATGPCSPMAPVVTFELRGSIPRNYPAKKEEEYESNGLDG